MSSIWADNVVSFQHRYPELDGACLDAKVFDVYCVDGPDVNYPVWDDDGKPWVGALGLNHNKRHSNFLLWIFDSYF